MTSSIAAPPQIHTIVTTTTATNGEEPLKILLKKYPILVNKNDQKPFHYEYGTAGFRYHYTKLPPIMIRMAILATLRSLALSKSSKNGFGVGIMITASHNPEQDNGMKISDYNGGMLHPNWEQMATILANKSNQEILSWLQGRNEKQHNNHQQQQQQQPIGEKKNAIIHVGRDTRSHSYALSQIVIQTILALANCIPQQHQPTTITIIDHGCITTPQLHYYVLRSNLHVVPNALLSMSSAIGYQHDYLHGIVSSYLTLISTDDNNYDDNNDHGKRTKESVMLVDCACGIGGLKIPMFNELLQRCQMEKGIVTPSSSINHNKLLQLIPFNLPHDGPLNHECGAEYVQKQQKFPTIYTKDFFNPGSIDDDKTTMEYVASLDGDADRIVFHYKDSKGKLVLLDGDKIAALVSSFLQQEVDHLARVVQEAKSIRCGVVQTAYANGASTNYLKVCRNIGDEIYNSRNIITKRHLFLIVVICSAINRIWSRQTSSLPKRV
jgi:phosphoacetylglucosamine mutase